MMKLFTIFFACYIGLITWMRGSVVLTNDSPAVTTTAATTTITNDNVMVGGQPILRRIHVVSDADRRLNAVVHDVAGTGTIIRDDSSKTTEEEPNFLPRVLAFVFPQFHRDELNDRLWGEGYTDWDNLRRAPEKNRLGYAIPRPTELGYYNYTETEPRRKQGELAREYELDGFIFHHYWFYDPNNHPGRPSLQAPLEAMLQDGYPNVPFALHWCASKWVNTWSGSAVRSDFVFPEPNVLQKQYFPTVATDSAITVHYQWLRQFFHLPNYIKVDGGKPLFMLYQKKPSSFLVLKRLEELAKADGFPGLYLTVGLTMPHTHLQDISSNLQDYVDHPPQKFTAIAQKYFQRPVAYPNPVGWNMNRTLEIPQWCTTAHQQQKGQQATPHERVPDIAGIISSFDNTPRRNNEEAVLLSADDPDIVVGRFRKSLHAALYYEACCFPDEKESRARKRRDDDDRFIVINAMNEWAEGMALEPSNVFGRKFLQAIRDAKQSVRESNCHYLGTTTTTTG